MPAPLTSGRTWTEDPEGNPVEQVGIGNLRRWVRDDDARSVRAIFKWHSRAAAIYSIGAERLAYHLGAELDLPIPPTYLDACEGQKGCAQLRIRGIAWRHAAAGVPLILEDVVNRDTWPLAIVFDLWIANPDRHDRNILVTPEPPDQKPAHATQCTTWLIDNGHSFLWPPGKFNAGNISSVRLSVDGTMKPELETQIAASMPDRYREAYTELSAAEKEPLLDRIRAISDNAIEAAVHEIPSDYFSSTARDMTMTLLAARRDHIGNLSDAVFS